MRLRLFILFVGVLCLAGRASAQSPENYRAEVGYAFWKQRRFQPRRKDAVIALAAIDPEAAELVRTWERARGSDALAAVETLARHVLGDDTFFEWASAPESTPASS